MTEKKIPTQKERIEQLEKEVAYLHEQLWYSQESLRRLMVELPNHISQSGTGPLMELLAEWSQIIHNINKDHGKV